MFGWMGRGVHLISEGTVEDSLCDLLAGLLFVLLLLSLSLLGRVGLFGLGRLGERAHGYGVCDYIVRNDQN